MHVLESASTANYFLKLSIDAANSLTAASTVTVTVTVTVTFAFAFAASSPYTLIATLVYGPNKHTLVLP